MKERPILFSSPMVQAILRKRNPKTQTRRVVNLSEFDKSSTPGYEWHFRGTRHGGKGHLWQDFTNEKLMHLSPYGVPGDKLWVKEGWKPADEGVGVWIRYHADGGEKFFRTEQLPKQWKIPKGINVASLYMPRWASRITLEITDVRWQKLQDISMEDALAEGIECDEGTMHCMNYLNPEDDKLVGRWLGPQSSFASLWDSIYGKKHPWANNDWVWAYTFRRINP